MDENENEKPVLVQLDGTPYKPLRSTLGFGRGVIDRNLPLEIQLNLKEDPVPIQSSGKARPARVTKVR